MFSVDNYLEGQVENSFVFLKSGESEADLDNTVQQNATIIINSNSAVLDGTFHLNMATVSTYPRCNSTSTTNSLRSFIFEPGMRFHKYYKHHVLKNV